MIHETLEQTTPGTASSGPEAGGPRRGGLP
jgi:hypothetical protein